MKFVFNRNDRKGLRKEADKIGVIFNMEVMEKRHREHRAGITKYDYRQLLFGLINHKRAKNTKLGI